MLIRMQIRAPVSMQVFQSWSPLRLVAAELQNTGIFYCMLLLMLLAGSQPAMRFSKIVACF
jgi:hypothetical protein